jgi:YidC/Oxa1 family membrane protein insertase
MDNQRLLIWAAFGFIAWLTYQAWLNDYAPQPVIAPSTTEATLPEVIGDSLPELSTDGRDEPAALPSSDTATDREEATTAPIISVTTDVLKLELSTQGGTIRRATLLEYPVAKDRPDELIRLLSPEANNFGAIRTGLRSDDAARPAPDHVATFTSPYSSYDLGTAEELVVPLSWTGSDGNVVEKRFIFTPGSYIVHVEQTVRNENEQKHRQGSGLYCRCRTNPTKTSHLQFSNRYEEQAANPYR